MMTCLKTGENTEERQIRVLPSCQRSIFSRGKDSAKCFFKLDPGSCFLFDSLHRNQHTKEGQHVLLSYSRLGQSPMVCYMDEKVFGA